MAGPLDLGGTMTIECKPDDMMMVSRSKLQECVSIIRTKLHHQREKVSDVATILNGLALSASPVPPSEPTKQLADWMLTNGFATGHGDTVEDLLSELASQVSELRSILPAATSNERRRRQAYFLAHNVICQSLNATGLESGSLGAAPADGEVDNRFLASLEQTITAALVNFHHPVPPSEPVGWRTIDSAPKDGTPVITCSAGSVWQPVIGFCDFDETWGCWESNGTVWAYEEAPTHWMPLPPVPGSEVHPSPPVSGEVVEADDTADLLNVLCEDFGCEPGSDRIHWLHDQLSALADMRDALRGCISYRNWEIAEGGVVPDELRDTWKRARSALAKARGEA